MEVIVKGIKLKAAAAQPFIYTAHFRRQFFEDILSIAKKFDKKTPEISDLSDEDIQILFNIFWTCAKIADSSIPERDDFFLENTEITIGDIISNVSILLENSFKTEKK